MTFGPWLRATGVSGSPVALAKTLLATVFQTTFGSSASVSACVSTTSVFVCPAASVPTLQAIFVAPRTASVAGETEVNSAPSAAVASTRTAASGAVPVLVTISRDGNVSPGFTHPTALTKEFSRRSAPLVTMLLGSASAEGGAPATADVAGRRAASGATRAAAASSVRPVRPDRDVGKEFSVAGRRRPSSDVGATSMRGIRPSWGR